MTDAATPARTGKLAPLAMKPIPGGYAVTAALPLRLIGGLHALVRA